MHTHRHPTSCFGAVTGLHASDERRGLTALVAVATLVSMLANGLCMILAVGGHRRRGERSCGGVLAAPVPHHKVDGRGSCVARARVHHAAELALTAPWLRARAARRVRAAASQAAAALAQVADGDG